MPTSRELSSLQEVETLKAALTDAEARVQRLEALVGEVINKRPGPIAMYEFQQKVRQTLAKLSPSEEEKEA